MLQIIGFLGCFYMLVRGIHWIGVDRNSDGIRIAAAGLAMLGSVGFSMLLIVQGAPAPPVFTDIPTTDNLLVAENLLYEE